MCRIAYLTLWSYIDLRCGVNHAVDPVESLKFGRQYLVYEPDQSILERIDQVTDLP